MKIKVPFEFISSVTCNYFIYTCRPSYFPATDENIWEKILQSDAGCLDVTLNVLENTFLFPSVDASLSKKKHYMLRLTVSGNLFIDLFHFYFYAMLKNILITCRELHRAL